MLRGRDGHLSPFLLLLFPLDHRPSFTLSRAFYPFFPPILLQDDRRRCETRPRTGPSPPPPSVRTPNSSPPSLPFCAASVEKDYRRKHRQTPQGGLAPHLSYSPLPSENSRREKNSISRRIPLLFPSLLLSCFLGKATTSLP